MLKFLKWWWEWTVKKLSENRGDLQQIFTPPKSKSPFEAATAGSTGGLFSFLAPSKNPILGPLLTGAAGAIPGIGPIISSLLGASGALGGGTGFQGTQRGFGGNLLSTGAGALGGFGLGGIGRGIAGGIQAALSPTGTIGPGLGFGQGASILGQGGGQLGGPLLNQFGAGFGASLGQTFGGAGRALGFGGPQGPTGVGGVGGGGVAGGGAPGGGFNLSSLSQSVLGGRQLLGAGLIGSTLLRTPPKFETDFPGRAKKILAEQPDLQLATSGMRALAFGNPSEILGPASDKFIEASLRQSRQANDRARKDLISRAETQGRTEAKSGSLRRQLREQGDLQLQRETDFITKTNEARQIAAVGIKVNAVAQFFNIAQAQAANLLAIEGFVTEQEALNFMTELQNFQGSQQLLGAGGGLLLG